MALGDFIASWSGTAYRHIPAGSPFDVLDFRFSGQSEDNRWNYSGEPTLYLASDYGVVIAEFARHIDVDWHRSLRAVGHVRQVYRCAVQIDRLLDLREPLVREALAVSVEPEGFLNRSLTRSIARYIRTVVDVQALLVPSVAFLDQPDRWVLVLFLEKLPADPSRFIPSVVTDATFRLDP
jgi:RES domain-containing protein